MSSTKNPMNAANSEKAPEKLPEKLIEPAVEQAKGEIKSFTKGNHSMSTANNKSENIGNTWVNGVSESVRDLVGLQFRTAQFAVEKSVGFGQAVTEFYQNQLNESLKLSQEYAKYGWGLTENVKKTAFEATDRALRGLHS